MSRAIVFGCAGPVLNDEERAFFRETDPYGFILFARNIESREQVRSLVDDLRGCVSHPFAPVLIDQEGGRVRRMRPPQWRDYLAPGVFTDAYAARPEMALEAFALSAELMAADLFEIGIDVDCVPMLDVRQSDSDTQVIGDRALGDDSQTVIRLGEAMVEGIERAGVVGVIKHLPGHGRSVVDSHADLPRIEASAQDLSAVDYVPFKHFAGRVPYGMTGHLLYTSIDAGRPSTLSPKVVGDVIRGEIGFDGLLFTDDISMGALAETRGGPLGERSRRSIEAGCDIVLHCNGDMDEMRAVAEAVGEMTVDAARRAVRADAHRSAVSSARRSTDTAGVIQRLDALLKDLRT
ncbi:MAG: beta-N-acetylhexosaminidase [Thalassobaculaceae bacterium]|nr:beta-N-acetylhexosaminidase [Thalassobaculaceae bacterium]